MTRKSYITWTLQDHLCKHCGGRIIRSASGAGPSPGGNPLFKCANCGQSITGMGPEVLCWCGFAHRGQTPGAYRCLPFSVLSEYPKYKEAFLECGCDPTKGEVGIVLETTIQKLLKAGN